MVEFLSVSLILCTRLVFVQFLIMVAKFLDTISIIKNLKIQFRAARSFLGVTKTTPIPGILSELNLLVPQYRTQIKMIRQFHRISKMANNRLTRKIFDWDKTIANEGRSSWYSEVKDIFTSNSLENYFEASTLFQRI